MATAAAVAAANAAADAVKMLRVQKAALTAAAPSRPTMGAGTPRRGRAVTPVIDEDRRRSRVRIWREPLPPPDMPSYDCPVKCEHCGVMCAIGVFEIREFSNTHGLAVHWNNRVVRPLCLCVSGKRGGEGGGGS